MLDDVDDDEAEASTVLEELDDDRLDRLLVEVVAVEVLLVLEELDDDPDCSTVELLDELLAVEVLDDEVENDEVVDVLDELKLDSDCTDLEEVELLEVDFSTTVDVVLDVDELEPVEVEEVELLEVDSVE